jgi:hypothetical protein
MAPRVWVSRDMQQKYRPMGPVEIVSEGDIYMRSSFPRSDGLEDVEDCVETQKEWINGASRKSV